MNTSLFFSQGRKFQCGILSLRSLCFFFGFSSLLILALLFTNTAVRVNGTNQADKSSRLFYRLNHKQSTDDANGKSADKRVGDITGESFKQIIKHDWEPLFNLMLVVCTLQMTLELELPWPPSVNHYYRHVGPRVLISRDGRKYRELVTALVNRNGFRPFPGRISLRAEFYPPDWRRRDLDNVGGKVLLDTLQAAGLFKDDSQIKRILLEMHEPIEGGMCFIKLEDMDGIEWKNEDRTADDAGKSSRNS